MEAILEVDGAHCASCVFAIEHQGRKVPGVRELRLDAAAGRMRVEYDGDRESLERICSLVERLGYRARIRESTSVRTTPATSNCQGW